MPSFIKISEWPDAMDELVIEGGEEGFRFLSRLKQDWSSGTNRFSAEGEILLGVFAEGRLVAVGGLNRESADTGRLRRLYMRKAWRRNGIGRQLVHHLLEFASQFYSKVVLRTDSKTADCFYCSMGFSRQVADGATHVFELRKN